MITDTSVIAAAAVIQTLATIVLVTVTARYVHLTKGILETARQELADSRALLDSSLQLSRGQLRGLLSKFSAVMDPLPPTTLPVQQLRRCAMWAHADEENLLHLAPGQSKAVAEAASSLVPSLMWLRQLHQRVIATNETYGYGVADKEVAEYLHHRANALKQLKLIQDGLEASQGAA